MVKQKIIDVAPCPKCYENHKNLPVNDEKEIIYRGDDSNTVVIVVTCPTKKEQFKVTIKKKT